MVVADPRLGSSRSGRYGPSASTRADQLETFGIAILQSPRKGKVPIPRIARDRRLLSAHADASQRTRVAGRDGSQNGVRKCKNGAEMKAARRCLCFMSSRPEVSTRGVPPTDLAAATAVHFGRVGRLLASTLELRAITTFGASRDVASSLQASRRPP
jgi:hypothetical protein